MFVSLRGYGGWLVATIWFVMIGCAMLHMDIYQATPGSVGVVPLVSPEATALATSPGRQHRLVMFIHPQCPCTKASLAALAKIQSCHQKDVRFEVLLVKPKGVADDWEQTPLAEQARSIPGVQVRCDHEAKLAERYGAHTSGHVLLYDSLNQLRFSGGITRSRGHEGDSPGSRSIEALLAGRTPEGSAARVFGCPLLESKPCCATKHLSESRIQQDAFLPLATKVAENTSASENYPIDSPDILSEK